MNEQNDTQARRNISKVFVILIIALTFINMMTSCTTSQQVYNQKFHKHYPCPTFTNNINSFDI